MGSNDGGALRTRRPCRRRFHPPSCKLINQDLNISISNTSNVCETLLAIIFWVLPSSEVSDEFYFYSLSWIIGEERASLLPELSQKESHRCWLITTSANCSAVIGWLEPLIIRSNKYILYINRFLWESNVSTIFQILFRISIN